MSRTKNEVLETVTRDYINQKLTNIPHTQINPQTIESEILDNVAAEIEIENATRAKGNKLQIPQTLSFSQIADIMAAVYPICRISCAGENADAEYDLLAMYQTSGENEGIYVTSDDIFRGIAAKFNYTMTKHEFEEIIIALRNRVPRKTRTMNPDLIPVNNGIFDYSTKTLMPFDPKFVFMAKSKVNYNPNATNPVIYNNEDNTYWDMDSWLHGLTDDDQITQLLWEILGAIVRPNVRWNKSAWFYSETGNNGKGTLCELMRQLTGSGTYASIPLSEFSKDFALEPLTRASAIIVDENDVGQFIDKAANLKAIITNDVIQINRKFKTPIAYQFYGFMVQCLNEFPRIKDKSDSFYRRQLFIPFNKCFTGAERKYIKEDYLHRPEVLEYVLHHVLNSNYYKLSEPDACKQILQDYKEFNDPVRQFFSEMQDEFVWDLLPFTFLYDLYRSWFQKNSPSGSPQGKNTFIGDIINTVAGTDSRWYCPDKRKSIRVSNRMDKPEPLIAKYGLKSWQNPNYTGNDINKICTIVPQPSYRGLLRYSDISQPDDDTTNPETENSD